jgi:hypothetical protein
MRTRRTGLNRIELLVTIAIVAIAIMLVLGVLNLYRRMVPPSTGDRVGGSTRPAHARGGLAAPLSSAGARRRYVPRGSLETSGLGAVSKFLPPWKPDASLEEISNVWRRAGYRAIELVDQQLAAINLPVRSQVPLLFMKSTFLNYEGEAERSYQVLEQLRSVIEGEDQLAETLMATLFYQQGVAAMRRGENDNCVMCRGESSCILPISSAAVHANPTGSRLAIRHFTEYLDRFPDDLEVRWLLNLAHMTLGEYPDKVDPRFRLNLDRFFHSEFDIGRFRDVGHLVGVNRFNQAGGDIMEDFDNDGLLDIVVTSFDSTQSMSYHHNKGDGTFEDRSREAGVTNQLGGLVCYQTDYDNDGRMDIFVARGAWLLSPIRPTLLRNNGTGGFTDVTREAGLLYAANSNSASWGDYDNDGWLDLFVCCERQPNRLYHNRRDGTFEEVSTRAGLQGDVNGFKCWKGSTWIDIDNDDYPELFLVQTGGAVNGDKYHNILFQNPGQGNHWLTIKLVGQKTNRAAIGVRIKLVTAGEKPLTVHRHVSSGSSFGANPLQQTIGLAEAQRVDLLEIHWPTSGTTQVFRDIAADQAIEVTEFAATYRPLNWKPIPTPE